MPSAHPVHALRDKLEAERLQRVVKLAADGTLSADALRDLATFHIALTAVREEIETHEVKLGWAGSKGLD